MVNQLLSLEWKKFFRSKSLNRSLAVKVFLIFIAIYFILSFLILGVGAYFILEEEFPEHSPIIWVNNFIIYWFLLELVYRFFIQNLPVMNVKPLMVFPIPKKKIVHYLLAKSTFSIWNILPLFFFLPFSVVLMTQGHSPGRVISWFFAMLFFELAINYANFLINKINTVFYVVLGVLLLFAGLHYLELFDITQPAGWFFNTLYERSYLALIPLFLMIFLYKKNYNFLIKGFYLDDRIAQKAEEAKSDEMTWLDRFGDIAVFLKNDLRLIKRNKRAKQVVLTSVLFLFYGLIFFPQEQYNQSFIWVSFIAIFVTGGFLMTFGQLVPSWDSEYYKLLMSQNIPYKKYLESKWYLMVTATGASMVLCIPYIYFGWKIFGVIIAGAFFNMGLNSFITLWGGALNRVPVELNVRAKAFSNTQGFNMTQMLIALPKIFLPILLFFVPYLIGGYWAGALFLGASGVVGLLLKDFFLRKIEKIYQENKYKTIAAFEEKE